MAGNFISTICCDCMHLSGDARDKCIARFVDDELTPLIPGAASVITFDGFDGVGKSTFARQLARIIGLSLIQLDDFREHEEVYLDSLKLNSLTDAVGNGLWSGGKIIIEGCMIDAALERINMTADFRIYVLHHSDIDLELITDIKNSDFICSELSADEFISKWDEERKQCWLSRSADGNYPEVPSLTRELIHYHEEHRPHDKANLIIRIKH